MTVSTLSRRSAVLAGMGALAALAIPSAATAQSETEVQSGVWRKSQYASSGRWAIVERDGARFVTLSADFSTQKAPDLKIFLSPRPASELTSRNVTQGALFVSELSSNKGAQSYSLPADLDLAAYRSIAIHCERFSKLWSVADLS